MICIVTHFNVKPNGYKVHKCMNTLLSMTYDLVYQKACFEGKWIYKEFWKKMNIERFRKKSIGIKSL